MPRVLPMLLAISLPAPGRAAEPCAHPAAPAIVIRCALLASPEARLAKQEMQVLAGHRLSARTLLPAHPLLSFTAAGRRSPEGGPVSLNWYLALSQEIEIGGQRWARLDVVDAEAAAQLRRVAVAEKESAAAALVAYYEVLAAKEERALSEDVGRIAATLASLGAARAREALLAPVDADVARAEAVRLALLVPEAVRRGEAAGAVLGALLGQPGPVEADGDLESAAAFSPVGPVPLLLSRALLLRGEIVAAEMEQRAAQSRLLLLRRQRVPNLTLSFLAQRDGFDEQVFGGGVAMPVPLPAPLFPSRAGEIGAATAAAAQAETTKEAIRRRVRLELQRAVSAQRAQAGALALFPADLLVRARADLAALDKGLSARQLPLREALYMQRSLIELLQAHLRARLAHALGSIELARASGTLP